MPEGRRAIPDPRRRLDIMLSVREWELLNHALVTTAGRLDRDNDGDVAEETRRLYRRIGLAFSDAREPPHTPR